MKVEHIHCVNFKTASMSVAETTLYIKSGEPSAMIALQNLKDPTGPWAIRIQGHPEASFLAERITATRIDRIDLRTEMIAGAQISHSKNLPISSLEAVVEGHTLCLSFNVGGRNPA
jgi:hypothetical protein